VSASGTQSIERAALLLRELSTRARTGWRLTDLAERCSLDRGTTRRMLACLVRERLALQRTSDRHYLPGPMLYELGLALAPLARLKDASQAPLARLAARFRCVGFLYLRSGEDFVCAARVGASTMKGLSVEVGTRRPLCVSAGGIAILVALPKKERAAALEDNLRRLRQSGDLRERFVSRMMKRSLERGVGLNVGEFVPNITAIGVALRDAQGMPFASLTLSGASELLAGARLEEAISAMETEARGIEARSQAVLAGLGPAV
jgi:DNA-binding IclR family transcriptional regulator